MTYKNLFEVLPMTPGPFVKAPCMNPFRPILHLFDGQLACHYQMADGSLHTGHYAMVGPEDDLSLPENKANVVAVVKEYATRVSQYMDHVSLTINRADEEPMGFAL